MSNMIRILEVDQFTSTGDIESYTMESFDLSSVKGGSSEVARVMFGGKALIRVVADNDSPTIGNVWFKAGPNGFLQRWKANYDSSD